MATRIQTRKANTNLLKEAFGRYIMLNGNRPTNKFEFLNFIEANNFKGIDAKEIGPFLERYNKVSKRPSKSTKSHHSDPNTHHHNHRTTAPRSPNSSRRKPRPPPRSQPFSPQSHPNRIYHSDDNVLRPPASSHSPRSTHSDDGGFHRERPPPRPHNIFSKSEDNVLSLDLSHSSIEDPSDGKQQQINNLCDIISDLRMQIKLLNLKDDQRSHELETLKNIKTTIADKYEKLKRKYNALKAKYKNKHHNNHQNGYGANIISKYTKLKEEYRSLKRKMKVMQAQYDTKCKEYTKQSKINESRADQLRRCITMNAEIQSKCQSKTKELNEYKHKYTKLEGIHNALVKRVQNMEEMTNMYQNEYEKLIKVKENKGSETSDDSSTKTENRKESETETGYNNATKEAIKALLELQDMMSDDDVVDVDDDVTYSLSETEYAPDDDKANKVMKEKKKIDIESSESEEEKENENDDHLLQINTDEKKKKYSVYSVDQDANYKIINTHFHAGVTRNANVSFTELDFDDLQSVRLPEPKSDDELLSGEEQSDSLSSSSF